MCAVKCWSQKINFIEPNETAKRTRYKLRKDYERLKSLRISQRKRTVKNKEIS